MDKQNLKKQHFWILLTLAVVLIPVVLGGAFFGVRGAVDKKMADIKSKREQLASANPKSRAYIAELDKQKEQLDKRRGEVWKQAYEVQGDLIRWPRSLEVHDKDYFGNPIPDSDRESFHRNNVYYSELYEPLTKIIEPTEFLGGAWHNVIHTFVPWDKIPTNEEIWLALEDVCVQRAVLHDIQAINHMMSGFLEVPHSLPQAPTAPPPGAASEEAVAEYQQKKKEYDARKVEHEQEKAKLKKELRDFFKVGDSAPVGRFLSPYWQLDLAVTRPPSGRAGEIEFRYKLTNVSTRRQNIHKIEFKVYLRNPDNVPDVDHVILPVEAEFLAAGAPLPADGTYRTETRTGSMPPEAKIYRVDQKLDLLSAPVKRVDQLALGYLPHRFANRQLVATSFSQQLMTEAAPAASPEPVPGPMGMGGGPQGNEQQKQAINATPQGIPRLRYLDRTDQVRRMPVAVVLVVDQAHVQDVLRAFANSRLRFQDAQFHWQRFRGSINLNPPAGGGELPNPPGGIPPRGGFPPGSAPGSAPGFPPRRGGGGGDMGGDDRPGYTGRLPQPAARGGFGGRRGPIFDPRQDLNQPPQSDEAAALVELTIYGLVSLYERFPPKAQPADGQPPAGAPGNPPPAGQPVPPAGGGVP